MTVQQAQLQPHEGTALQRAAWHNRILLGILVIAAVLYGWKFNSFQVGVYMDDAEYVVLAKSIAVGPSYGLINEPAGVQPTRYPFGWPLLLAPAYAVSDGDFQALKLVSFLATLANITIIGLAWRWLGLRSAGIGLATAAVYAFLPMTVGHAGMVMSEAAFLTAVLVCLALSTYLASSTENMIVAPLLLGLTWMLAAFTRTIGITAVAACVAYLAWHRRWRSLALGMAGLAASVLLVVALTPVTATDVVDLSEYRTQLSNPADWGMASAETSILARAFEGADHYLRWYVRDALIPFIGGPSTGALLARFGLGWAPDAVGIFMAALVLVGYILTLRNGFHPAHLYVPAYLAILTIWPWQGDRFLYGVLPLLIGYVIIAGVAIADWIAQRLSGVFAQNRQWGYRIAAVILIAWLGILVTRSAMIGSSTNHTPDQSIGSAWIKENTPLDSVVAAEQPLSVHLYSERATTFLTQDPMTIQELACNHPFFVLVAPKLEWRNDGTLVANPVASNMIKVAQTTGVKAELVLASSRDLVQVVRLVGSCE